MRYGVRFKGVRILIFWYFAPFREQVTFAGFINHAVSDPDGVNPAQPMGAIMLWMFWGVIVEYSWLLLMALAGILPFIGKLLWTLTQPLKFLTLVVNSGMTFLMKSATTKGIRQAIDQRVVTMDGKSVSVEGHRANAINRRDRMHQYVDKTKQDLQTYMNGPLGCSVLLQLTRDDPFYQQRKYLEKCIKIFDALEDEIGSRIHLLDDELNAIRERSNWRINLSERALGRLKRAHVRALRRAMTPSLIKSLWANMVETNQKWSMVRLCTRKLKKLRKQKKKDIKRVNKQYDRILRPHFARMHDFEIEYLGHRIHEYQAAFASFKQTIVSGRTLALMLEKTPQAQAVREKFGLTMLPHNKPEAQKFFVEQLRGRCGYHPYISIAELFEMWLRVHYHDQPDDKLPTFELLDQSGFRLWLVTLPPPAAVGLAHAAYNHAPHLGATTGWITSRPPEATVHTLGEAAE